MKKIISDEFWNCMKDLFSNNQITAGRPPMSARRALSGIMYVLENGSKWRFLPSIYEKPSTVHGTLMRWVRNGTFKLIVHRARQFYLERLDEIPKWFAIDVSSSKAPYANWSGKNPVDRSKRGIKKSIIIDWNGAPLGLAVGGANRHDSVFVKETLDDMVKLETNNFKVLAADSAYDAKKLRDLAKDHGFVLHSAINKRRKQNCNRIVPGSRWKVEASHSWFNNFRSLKTCWTKTKEAFIAFLQLGASVVLFRKGIIFG